MKRMFFGLLAIGFALCLSSTNDALAQSAIEFFAEPADTVIAPDSDSLDIDGTEFTMEAWVFTTDTQNVNGVDEGIIINKEDSYEMALRAGDKFMFAIQAGAWDWFGGGKPTMNEWHHLAVTYDGTTTQGWIDGVAAPDPTDRNTTPITPQDGDGSPFQIGHRFCCDGVPFFGIIDEVRISDVVRYTKDFALPTTEFAPDKNTRLLWHLNEGSGTEVSDASGNKNTGKLEGGPKWVDGAPISPVTAVQPDGKLATMWAIVKSRR
jgi:hypothetical protein